MHVTWTVRLIQKCSCSVVLDSANILIDLSTKCCLIATMNSFLNCNGLQIPLNYLASSATGALTLQPSLRAQSWAVGYQQQQQQQLQQQQQQKNSALGQLIGASGVGPFQYCQTPSTQAPYSGLDKALLLRLLQQQQQFLSLHAFSNSERYHPRPHIALPGGDKHHQLLQRRQRHTWAGPQNVSRSSSVSDLSLKETFGESVLKPWNPTPDCSGNRAGSVESTASTCTSSVSHDTERGCSSDDEDSPVSLPPPTVTVENNPVPSQAQSTARAPLVAVAPDNEDEEKMQQNRGIKRHPQPGFHSGNSPIQKRPRSEERDPVPASAAEDIGPRLDACQQISDVMLRFYRDRQQTEEVYAQKMQLRDALYAVMKDVFPYCGLYVVGSSMNAFGSHSSDMDLCLMISYNDIDQKKEATEFLRIIQKALHKCKFLNELNLIRAKVPILKFKDCVSGVECDLNINNSVGIRNTHLLSSYAKLDWRVSPMVQFVKHWARCHNINDASQGSISSYSLVLMVIHYLQCGCTPCVLPSLQQRYPHKFDASIDIRLLTLNDKLPRYTSINKQSLGELFMGFLHYYAQEFSFDQHAISIRLGRKLSKSFVAHQCPARNPPGQWKFLCIEEPFDLSNTARSVYDPVVFKCILTVFRKSHGRLRATKDVYTILNEPL